MKGRTVCRISGVIIEGKGINIISGDESDLIIGFFTTRMVCSDSAEDAENKAKEMIAAEWTKGHYAKANNGRLPTLRC